jgi:uncharacterized protein
VAEEFVAKDRLEKVVAGGQIVVEVTADAMLAALSLHPNESGQPFVDEEVTAFLKTAKVVQGIEPDRIHEAIQQAAATKAPIQRAIVARGQPKREGRDAYFEYPAVDRVIAEQTETDDTVALRPQRFTAEHVINVREGETVAVFHPKDEGQAGFTVYGQALNVKAVADQTPKPGQNLRWEYRDLAATVEGRLIITDTSICVQDVLEFPGDLTLNEGNVDFNGAVVVGRNVEAGLTIRCQKDLVVKGTLLGSNVHCGGNLVVEKGIVGSENTTIEVRGNLTARFVESANLRVWGSATIADSFNASKLLCGDTLNMKDGEGHFISGHASARCGIAVREVGIPLGTKARLSVGRDMLAKERVDQIIAEMERLKVQHKNIKELGSKVGPMTKAYQKLPPRKQEEIELLLDQLPRLERVLNSLQREADDLKQKLAPLHDVNVVVLGKACSDTIVEFPLAWTRVESEVSEVEFRFSDETAKVEWVAAAA